MMIRLCQASALVTLYVLVWAAVAHAECAWVLWQQLVEPDSLRNPKELYKPLSGQYDLLRAYRGQGECEAALATASAAKPKGKDLLVCLPDTVDPRGLKGK